MTQHIAQMINIPFEFAKLGHGYSPPRRISMHNSMILLTQ
jgi:hypothetical protein